MRSFFFIPNHIRFIVIDQFDELRDLELIDEIIDRWASGIGYDAVVVGIPRRASPAKPVITVLGMIPLRKGKVEPSFQMGVGYSRHINQLLDKVTLRLEMDRRSLAD
jgi:hypothetical protein